MTIVGPTASATAVARVARVVGRLFRGDAECFSCAAATGAVRPPGNVADFDSARGQVIAAIALVERISAAMAVPTKSLSARRRLRESSASALARSSKERSLLVWSSFGIVCLLPVRRRSSVAPPRFSAPRLPPKASSRRPLGFAPPPYDGFALLASAYTDALGYRRIPRMLAIHSR